MSEAPPPKGTSTGARHLDRHRAVTVLQQKLAEAPAKLANGFAQVVRRSPDEQLERVLQTPVRQAVLAGIFLQMPRFLDRRAAKDVDATARWRITGRSDGGADVWDVTIRDGRCRVRRGEFAAQPRVTVTAEAAEFVRLATGNSDPMQAYFRGRVQLAGDIIFAAKLQTLFRFPGRTPVAG